MRSQVPTPSGDFFARVVIVVLLGFLGFSVAAIFLSDQFSRKRVISNVESMLVLKGKTELDYFSEHVSSLRRDAIFLSQTPPTQGLARAAKNDGFDPQENSSSQLWTRRLATIFAAYMDSHTNVYQVRYIGIADGGRELVRVDRRDKQLVVVPESELQPKAERDYFQSALDLKPGNIFLSNITLNREFGVVEVPHRPTLRVVTPVFDVEDQYFGMIVINVNMDALLTPDEIAGEQVRRFIVNSDGDYLLHPSKVKTFGFDLERRYRWQDEFSPIDVEMMDSGFYRGAAEKVLVETQTFFLDDNDKTRKIIFLETYPEADIHASVVRSRVVVFLLLAGVAGIGGIGVFLVGINLQRNEEFHIKNSELAAIVDSSNDAIIGKTLDGVITSWNAAAERMFGFNATEAVGAKVADLLVPLERQSEEAEILQQVANGEIVPHFDTVRLCKDGRELDVSLTVSPVRGPDGSVIGAAKIARDISKEKAIRDRITELNLSLEEQVTQRTAELQRALALQAAILDRAGYAIYYGNADGVIEVFNNAAEELLGYTSEEVIGKRTPIEFIDPVEVEARFGVAPGEVIKTVGMGATPTSLIDRDDGEIEWTYITKTGERVPVNVRYSSLRDDAGNVIGHLAIVINLSERKQRESELIEARERAEAGSKAKSEFLANMSHEIRTPMNAVLGMISLLERSELTGEQHNYVSKAGIAAKTLLEIINDILDFSKIEANKLQLDPQPFDIEMLLRDIAVILGMNVGERDVELLFHIDPQLPRNVIGDSIRLKQVLINLAGNALKFTEKGEVALRVEVVGRGDGRVRIEFGIRDTGIGMSPEQQSRLFESFSQAEAGTSRRFGGTGLGLVISRRLIGIMGGELTLQSALGEGSDFRFVLDLELVEKTGIAQTIKLPPLQLRNLRVLIVDDHEEARRLLSGIARSLTWQPVQASSGEEALTHIKRSIALNKPFDVALIDWMMPGLDGWETAKEIRELLYGSTKLPMVVMVTAHTRSDLMANIKAQPKMLDGFLVKPVTPSEILDAVADCLSNRIQKIVATPGVKRQSASQRPLAGMRILLVDDNATNLEVARSLLELEGAEVTEATGGLAAVEALEAGAGQFHVVLMDVQMPDLDGHEATRRIRGDLGLKSLPIIAMTANAMPSDREACLEAGMDDHIGKPFDLAQLVALLLRRTAWDKNNPNALAALPVPAPAPDSGLPQKEGFDFDAAMGRMGNNRELLLRQIRSFGEKNGSVLAEIRVNLDAGDAKTAARQLHTLRGISATLGAVQLAGVISRVESEIKAGGSPQELAPLLEDLDLAMGRALSTFSEVADKLEGDSSPVVEVGQQPAGPLPDAELAELEILLRDNNMRAMTLFNQIAPDLPNGNPRVAKLSEAVNSLKFAEALALVRELRDSDGSTG